MHDDKTTRNNTTRILRIPFAILRYTDVHLILSRCLLHSVTFLSEYEGVATTATLKEKDSNTEPQLSEQMIQKISGNKCHILAVITPL